MKTSNKVLASAVLGLCLCGAHSALAQYSLVGNSIAVGVGSDGSIINPSGGGMGTVNFAGSGAYSGLLGIEYSTANNGTYPVNNDLITPGDPYQDSSLGVGGTYGTASYADGHSIGGTTTLTSSGSTLSTLTTGGGYGGVSFSQSLSFGMNSTVIHYVDTFQNTTGGTLANVVFATGFDPDPDLYQYNTYATHNNILSPSVVQASGAFTGNTILIQGLTPGSVPSVVDSGAWPNDNPYSLLHGIGVTSQATGYTDYNDASIYEAWSLGDMTPGETETISFNYIVNGTPVTSTSPVLGGGGTGAPDSGSTCALLGLALAGLGYGRRLIAGKRA